MAIRSEKASDLTETLIKATERAGAFKHVIVIFDGDGDYMHCFSNDECSTEHMNYMLDHTKLWLLGMKEDD